MSERESGRPATGTGAHFVTIHAPERGSWQLCIGKELWRAIGNPAYISLDRHGNSLRIGPEQHGDEPGIYSINGGDKRSMPRINIGGRIAREEYQLRPGRFENCRIVRGKIVVFLF